jgi:hypothetical protein
MYLAHSLVSRCYARDLPTGVGIQNAVKDRLRETFPSLELEVHTPNGQIDCVTDDAIYEVAKLRLWKHALGQLCAYRLHLARRKSILHLYALKEDSSALERVKRACSHHGVDVEFSLM